MKPVRPLVAVLLLAAVTIIAYPSTTSAIPIHRHVTVHRTVGGLDAGAPIAVPDSRVLKIDVAPSDADDDGIPDRDDECPQTAGERAYEGCPPPAPEPPAPDPTAFATTPTTSTLTVPTTSGGCPSYMAAEATSPTAVNPTSGASGCFQVLPSTAADMGPACSDVNSSECVGAICAAQGNDAWAASGATPCG